MLWPGRIQTDLESRRRQGQRRRLASVVPNWQYFKEKAFPLRHKIIHGEQGSTGREFSKERVEAMLLASSSIAAFALQHSVNLYQRLPVRRRMKSDRR
jgi:hypothetical protein